MAVGFGRAVAAALAGGLTGLGEAAVRRDEKRDEQSKLVYASAVKEADAIKERRQKLIDDSLAERKKVRALMLRSVNGERLTEPEALAAVQQADAMGIDDPAEILDKYNIVSEDTATIVESPSETRKVEVETEGLIAEGRGRTIFGDDRDAVTSQAQDLLRATGRDLEFEMPAEREVTGVTFELKPEKEDAKTSIVQVVNTDTKKVVQEVTQQISVVDGVPKIEYFNADGSKFVPSENLVVTDKPTVYTKEDKPTGFQIGSFTILDPETEEPRAVEGRLNPNLGVREILDTDTGKYVPAPNNATWNGKTPTVTRQEDDPRYMEVYTDAKKSIFEGSGSKQFKDLTSEYLSQRAGVRTLFANYEILAPLALDRRNYSFLNRSIGSFVTGTQNEFAGISSIFAFNTDENGNPVETEFDGFGILSQLQENEVGLRAAQDAASKAKLMENLALQMAIADIIADGDPRPSDFDVRARMDQYRASSPESFLRNSRSTIQRKMNALEGKLTAIKETGTYREMLSLSQSSDMSDLESKAYKELLNTYAPPTTEEITLPAIAQDDFDASQYTDEAYPELPEESEMSVPVNIPDRSIISSRVEGSNIILSVLNEKGEEQSAKISLDEALKRNYITEEIYNQYKGQ
jgi:hypothetical protein